MAKYRNYLTLVLFYADIVVIIVGLVCVGWGYYHMWKDKYEPAYIPFFEGLAGYFLTICSIFWVFVAEFILLKFFWKNAVEYLKIAMIFFTVQFILGVVLIILHLPNLLSLYMEAIPEKFKKIGFIFADIPVGLTLIINSILFFIRLKKDT